MKWINYHHLIYFKEIATQGSVSKAANILKVGQPALSSQLKNLEENLGVQLFERKNRKLILTEAGKVTLDYAKNISSLGQELIQVIEDKTFSTNIKLSLGALDSIPKNLICDIVDLAQKKTNCFLTILEDSPENLLRKLLVHQIDVILSDHEISNLGATDIFSKRILKKKIGVYASPDYAHLKKGFPKSLNLAPCIVPTIHSKTRSEVEHYFYDQKIHPRFITETQDTSLQKILASRGDGIVFLPEFSTKDLVKSSQLIKIGTLKDVFAEYYLIYNKRVIENPAVELILKQNFDKMKLG
jgi:LysR family transcriptional activator of nhaA